jgi:hypothetical protein
MQYWNFKNVKKFSGVPEPSNFLWKLSMIVEINQKELYYSYYTSGKFLTLKFKFQVKSSDLLPNFRYFATALKISAITIQH